MSDDSDDGQKPKKRDYEVGYGKPPKHSQFQPGHSGNSKGPKKGSRSLKTDLLKALNTKHTIKIAGKTYRGRTQELAMIGLALRAASGELKAQKQLVDLVLRVFGADYGDIVAAQLSQRDQEFLARALGRQFDVDRDDNDSAEGEPA